MGFVALAVLVVVAIAVAVGVHTGPHGLLAAGGAGVAASVGFVLGIILLAPPSSRPAIAWAFLAGAAALSASALVAGALTFPALRRHQPAVGATRLWGAEGIVLTDLDPVGTVRVRGETWTAESASGPLAAGSRVHVVEVDGLRLRVWSDSSPEAEIAGLYEQPERFPGNPGIGQPRESEQSEEQSELSEQPEQSEQEERTWPQ